MPTEFYQQLSTQLLAPLPGRAAQQEFAHELSYGRHFGPAPDNARQAAVLLLLSRDQDEWWLSFIRRPTGDDIHAGQICFPGGGIDAGESVTQAALRECEEELGWRPKEANVVGLLSPIYVYASNNRVSPVVAVTAETPEWNLCPREVAQLIQVPVTHLANDACVGETQLRRRGLSWTTRCFRWQGHSIWGATAMILAELRSILQTSPNRV